MDRLDLLTIELVKMVNSGSESSADIQEMIESHMKLAYALGNRDGFSEAQEILLKNMGNK